MQLDLSEEQVLIRDSVESFVARDYTFDHRRVRLEQQVERHGAPDLACWAQFAELGWLGVGLPEALGGFGGGPVEHMVICEAFGSAMVLEPFVSTAVVGARALELADDSARAAELAGLLAAGDWRTALAAAEPGGRYDLHHVATTASTRGNSTVLTGTKSAVVDAPWATHLLVVARAGGNVRDREGIGLYLVERNARGLERQDYTTMDGRLASHLKLSNAPAEVLVAPERGLQVLDDIVDRGIAARAAEATGAMGTAHQQTLEYMKSREQFGQALGSFQVIQHRLVDLLMHVHECRAAILRVANELNGDGLTGSDGAARRKAVSGTKVLVGRRARALAQEVVQLHGGVGMTEELAIGHFFRYLTQFCTAFGSTAHHLERYTQAR